MSSIHEYIITNGGECHHEDNYRDYGENYIEYNESMWKHRSYEIDWDLIPEELLSEEDDELVKSIILDYYHGRIAKPDWIL